MTTTFQQLSLFDIGVSAYPVAANLFDGEERQTMPTEAWMTRLLPDSEFLVMVGKHPCLLRRTDLNPADIFAKGMAFCHWRIGEAVYSGVYIGGENDAGNDETPSTAA